MCTYYKCVRDREPIYTYIYVYIHIYTYIYIYIQTYTHKYTYILIYVSGISPEDAVFLPSVETAVSFVQAAGPTLGERVLVVGQGLIGMLTAAVLKISNIDLTIADVSEKRLEAAMMFNTDVEAWNPKEVYDGKPFDLSIEVSGHSSGLQTAVDNTGW
jgi:threonine dehydrogenase-like Zn-dependent dehydrogenase